MAVIIVPRFNRQQIESELKKRREKIYAAILLALRRAGEQFVNNARENRTYKDQTGNLRSSIGYIILRDGVQLTENFRSYPSGGLAKSAERKANNKKKKAVGKKGKDVGAEIAKKIAAKYPFGFVLIGVAGMDYAAAVEAKGYDVISNSSITAADDLKAAVTRIKNKI